MDLLEVVKLDAKSFTSPKVVQEGVIGLFGFSCVALCKVHKVRPMRENVPDDVNIYFQCRNS